MEVFIQFTEPIFSLVNQNQKMEICFEISCLNNREFIVACRMYSEFKKVISKIQFIDLPENVAHRVAINVENSTVMAPLSLYAVTCVKIITPIAKRLYVPDAIISVILFSLFNEQ